MSWNKSLYEEIEENGPMLVGESEIDYNSDGVWDYRLEIWDFEYHSSRLYLWGKVFKNGLSNPIWDYGGQTTQDRAFAYKDGAGNTFGRAKYFDENKRLLIIFHSMFVFAEDIGVYFYMAGPADDDFTLRPESLTVFLGDTAMYSIDVPPEWENDEFSFNGAYQCDGDYVFNIDDTTLSWFNIQSPIGDFYVVGNPSNPGTYKFMVDFDNIAMPQGDDHYYMLAELKVTDFLDISIDNVEFNPTNPYSGQTVQIINGIANNGNLLLNGYKVDTYITGPNSYSKNLSAPPSSQASVIIDWVTTGMIGGTYNITSIISHEDDMHASNDSFSTQLQVSPPLTLLVNASTDKQQYSEGETVNVINFSVTDDNLNPVEGATISCDLKKP